MNELSALSSLGLELPSPAYIIGAILFGLLGLVAWRYGRQRAQPTTKWLGVALMVYPYVVSSTWGLYLVGVALCAGIWVDQRQG
jgi:hypothetical protein